MDRKTSHNSKKQRISPLLLSGLYPPPGTLPNPILLKRGFGSVAGGDRRGAGLAHDCVLNRAERVHARLVGADRVSPRCIATGVASNLERIAALAARRQRRIDHAGTCRGRYAGAG